MPKWGAKTKDETQVYGSVIEGLQNLYCKKIRPLEENYDYASFHSPYLEDSDFSSKPMVMLMGQYSTGKTTFVRYLIEGQYPGMRIGPEPTTDGFVVIMSDEQSANIPGNALVVDPSKPFRPLHKFGNAFLNRLSCATMPNPVLDRLTIIDTPGILSGEKQRLDRGYDFCGVLEWFAERVDRIILLFDAHKLDISDEFKRSIESIKKYEEKIRIVLNKADGVNSQQLMRVYGALMWSLGKVINTPEVTRVYIGSFWDEKLVYDTNRPLFELETQDLIGDLKSLPRITTLRKLNDLIKRARLALVHSYIISSLKKDMPSVFGKEAKKRDIIEKLDQVYQKLHVEHNISPGDFPDLTRMREKLKLKDFDSFRKLNMKLVDTVNKALANDIPRLMQMIPKEEAFVDPDAGLHGGAFEGVGDTPFGLNAYEGIDAGRNDDDWVVSKARFEFDKIFDQLGPIDGKISGSQAKAEMVKSRLPNSQLGRIWKISDVDNDGKLDSDEWSLASYLIQMRIDGHEIPAKLPNHLIPPSKRHLID